MKKSSGFTLIEILIGIFVFTLLCTAAFLVFSYGLKVSVYNATNVQLQRNASIAMERMLTETKDAVFLPWQTGIYNPRTPPSPVFRPFINEPNTDPAYSEATNHVNDPNQSVFCFTAPIPTAQGAGGFDYTSNTNYRLVCYYVDTNFIPSDPNANPVSGTHALIRRTLQFGMTLPASIFNPNWSLITSTPKSWTWTSDPNSRPEVIIQMPFPSDSIYFFVSHEQKKDYWRARRVEFQTADASVYGNENNIYDPLSFKIIMKLIQYPHGKTSYNRQEIKLDGLVQIRAAYH
ncbi:MAG: prepilin-type N-terminal cleavage/methylation domain-containing protein [Candidatus Eremiobacterota bacterium]